MEALSRNEVKIAHEVARSILGEFESLVDDAMQDSDVDDESAFYAEILKQFKKLL